MATSLRCPHCGAGNTDVHQPCVGCGRPLKPRAAASLGGAAVAVAIVLVLAVLLGGVVLVGAAGWFLVSFESHEVHIHDTYVEYDKAIMAPAAEGDAWDPYEAGPTMDDGRPTLEVTPTPTPEDATSPPDDES